jgi:hypothetical protein
MIRVLNRSCRWMALSAALLLALPASAGAWSAGKVSNDVFIWGEPGEVNEMTIGVAGTDEFHDAQATYHQTDSNCRATPGGGAECGGLYRHVTVSLGDRDDSLVMNVTAGDLGASRRSTRVRGGTPSSAARTGRRSTRATANATRSPAAAASTRSTPMTSTTWPPTARS